MKELAYDEVCWCHSSTVATISVPRCKRIKKVAEMDDFPSPTEGPQPPTLVFRVMSRVGM